MVGHTFLDATLHSFQINSIKSGMVECFDLFIFHELIIETNPLFWMENEMS